MKNILQKKHLFSGFKEIVYLLCSLQSK